MNVKRIVQISALVLVFVLFAASLSACKMPASTGPQATQDFVVPGETQGGPDYNAAGTATAQAAIAAQTTPVPAGNTPAATQVQAQPTQAPAATATPGSINPPPTQSVQQPQVQPTYVDATIDAPATYTLQAGEFPFCIARRFDVDQYELLSVNGLSLSSQVRPGITLTIPQTGNGFSGERSLLNHPATYTVKAGDTINSIACAYGDVAPEMIALQNGLQAPYNLEVGQKLTIP